VWVLLTVIISCLLVVGSAAVLLSSADNAEEKANKPLVIFAWVIICLFVLSAVIVISYLAWKKWHHA